MSSRREYDPIQCADCTYQSDNDEDYEWIDDSPLCDDCFQHRYHTALMPDTVEEYQDG